MRAAGGRVAAWGRAHPAGLAALVYAALALLMFGQGLLPGRTLSESDTLWYQVPWNGVRPDDFGRPSNLEIGDVSGVYQPFVQYLDRELPDLPLWNPHIQSGRPFEANSQSAFLSPFTALSVALPFWFSLAVVAAAKLWFAAFGTFLLGRALGMRTGGALLAGVVFGFSLWLVTWVGFTNVSVWVVMPWLLWAVDRVMRRPAVPNVALLAALVALQFFGGHPESSFITLLATSAFFALRAGSRWRDQGAFPAHAVAAVALGLGLGALLAAITLLPLLELLFDSADVEQREDLGSRSKLPSEFLFGLMLPDYWGRPTQTALVPFLFGRAVYVGALPLMLAGVALVLRPTRERIAVGGFGAACLAIVFGAWPIFHLVTSLPVFEVTHNTRLVVIFALCLALLAGWGLDDLLSPAPATRRRRALALALCAGLLVFPVVWIVGLDKASLSVLGGALDVAWGFADPPGLVSAIAGTAGEISADAADIVRLSSLVLWLSFAGAGLALVALGLRGRLPAGALATLAVLLVTCDLFRAGMGQNPAVERDRAVQPATGAIRYLQSRRPARFTGVGLVPQTNLPMRYGLYDARGYDLPIEKRYDTLWRREVTPELPSQAGPFLPLALTVTKLTPRALRTLSLLGVADVLQPPGDPPPRLPGLRPAYAGPDARVWANDNALPRAFVVGGQQVVEGGDAALDAFTRPGFDARASAVTERTLTGLGAPGRVGTARIATYEPDRVVLRVRAQRPGLVVLGDNHYSGWKAKVDGREAGVERVNYVMRGVLVGAGEHEVEFRFAPATFRIGWILSLLTALGLIAGVLLSRRRRRQAGAPEAVPTNTPPASYSSSS